MSKGEKPINSGKPLLPSLLPAWSLQMNTWKLYLTEDIKVINIPPGLQYKPQHYDTVTSLNINLWQNKRKKQQQKTKPLEAAGIQVIKSICGFESIKV